MAFRHSKTDLPASKNIRKPSVAARTVSPSDAVDIPKQAKPLRHGATSDIDALDYPKQDKPLRKGVTTDVDELLGKVAANMGESGFAGQNSSGCKARGSGAQVEPSPAQHAKQSQRASVLMKPGADTSPRRPSVVAGNASKQPTSARSGASQNKDAANRSPAKLIAAELNRKFSFAECSIAQLTNRIIAEEPDTTFHADFWHVVLTKSFAVGFQPIQNRTLSSWVQTFNKWQELRESGAQDAPAYVSGETLGKLLCLQKTKLHGIVRLFDDSFQGQVSEGIGVDISKARVHMPSLFVAGVITSQYISTAHKLAFVFGLFDLNDDCALDRKEFGKFMHCFAQGLVYAYGVADQTSVPPKQMAEDIANRYYERIAKVAAQRIKEIHKMSTPEAKQVIENEIRKRLCAKPTHNEEPGIKFQTLKDWCMQETIDPLGSPYALALQRYCPIRSNCVTDADEYDEAFADFRLSHSCLIPVPERGKLKDAGLITRKEVLLSRSVFEYCTENDSFGMRMDRIESGLSQRLPFALKERLETCLRKVAMQSARLHFRDFLRLLCPKAQPRHIRMFEDWCIQQDKMIQAKQNYTEMSKDHKAVMQKPFLPTEDIQVIRKRFQTLDIDGSGFLEPFELMKEFGFDNVESVKAMLAEYDISGDALIDETEFLRMNCPPEYRLPNDEDIRELSVSLLRVLSYNRQQAEQGVLEFNTTLARNRRNIAATLPEVPDEIWRQWNQSYDKLDLNQNGFVAANELDYAGVLPQRLYQIFVDDLAGSEEQGFTRRSFLECLLEAHGWWRHGFSTSEQPS